jgi:hypothetical protein
MAVFQGKVLRNEPVLLSALVQVILGLVMAFGVDLTNEQVGSIMAVTAIVLAILTRMFVTPNSALDDAAGVPPPTAPLV